MTEINFGGITPISTSDFPKTACSIIYLRGCPLNCVYCHNRHLLSGTNMVDISTIINLVSKNIPLISGIMISGGECTMQLEPLYELLTTLKQTYYPQLKLAIHTSGVYPDNITKLLPLLDHINIDLKASTSQEYINLTGKNVYPQVIESLNRIIDAHIPFTIHHTIYNPSIATSIQSLGFTNIKFQKLEPIITTTNTIN